MIIQCEQCQTKFKLDDSKVAEKSLRVRCARCRHVFSVSGPTGVTEDAATAELSASVFQIEEDQELNTAQTPEPDADSASDSLEGHETSEQSDHLGDFFFSDDDEHEPSDAVDEHADEPAADDSGFPSPETDSADAPVEEEPVREADDLDFGAFDFGDEIEPAAEPAADADVPDFGDVPVEQEPAAAPHQEEFRGLDFSGDDMFGDVVSTTPEETAEPISFDMGIDGFADSMGGDSGLTGQESIFISQDAAAETPFSLDDIDFGDELTSVAVQQVSTEELKPGQDLLFAPLAAPQEKIVFDIPAAGVAASPAAPDDLPPLSISSRRKESHKVSGMLIFMGVIVAALVLFYSIWGYMALTEDKSPKTTQDTGRVTVRSVEASFVKNKKAGDLLVITGEAVNEYSVPRAAIQIKGIVFDANGEELSTKSAFCGNPLTKEQLATMPLDKIEAAMANQFGDSLANMEIAAGSSIPFVIVISKLPAEGTDYGVEPVGSTVATGGKDKEPAK